MTCRLRAVERTEARRPPQAAITDELAELYGTLSYAATSPIDKISA